MPGMPYHLEKGPWLSILEDYLNADIQRRIDALAEMRATRDEGSLADLSFMRTPALEGDPDYPTFDDRRDHLQRDWFGSADGSPPDFVRQAFAGLDDEPSADVVEAVTGAGIDGTAQSLADFAARLTDDDRIALDAWPTTGFWFQYHGDVESIVRESLIRAIEVSLGLDHDEEVGRTAARELPIELFWKCPQRWFEGWLTWRWDPHHRTGQVTVMLATPGSGKPVLEAPEMGVDATRPDSSRVDGVGDAPTGPGPTSTADPLQSPKGMWVISHADHVQLSAPPDDRPSPSGSWVIPPFGPTYVGVGPVICVQPDERDGGVRPFGRPYVDPDVSTSTSAFWEEET